MRDDSLDPVAAAKEIIRKLDAALPRSLRLREHKCIPPMPAILDPNIPEAAALATCALTKIIGYEVEKLRILVQTIRAIHDDPALLTEEVRRDLHAGYEVVGDNYYIGGSTANMEEIGEVAARAWDAIGLLSGDRVLLSDGEELSPTYGFTTSYSADYEHDVEEAKKRLTCATCLPNFQARIDFDRARGTLKATSEVDGDE